MLGDFRIDHLQTSKVPKTTRACCCLAFFGFLFRQSKAQRNLQTSDYESDEQCGARLSSNGPQKWVEVEAGFCQQQ